jgi:hypothetical protein
VILLVALQVGLPQPPVSVEPPRVECEAALLEIGSQIFGFNALAPAEDGSFTIPADGAPDSAYWVAGSELAPLFYLSPTAANRALVTSLAEGEPVRVTWQNCNTTSFTLFPAELEANDLAQIAAGLEAGIAIAVQDESAAQAWVARSELQGEEIFVFSTPDPNEMLAEIGLLEVSTSEDRTSITVRISIYNAGQSQIALEMDDVSLMTDGEIISRSLFSEPALPKNIAPGSSEEFFFTFVRPTTTEATFRVFDIEYDLENY